MWCARLPLSRPDSAVVVRAGRNWATFGSPFFLRRLFGSRVSNPKMLKYFGQTHKAFTLTC